MWPLHDLMGKLGPLDHTFFSNGLIRLHCTFSNYIMGPKFSLRNFRWHVSLKGAYMVVPIPHRSSHISKVLCWLPILDFGIGPSVGSSFLSTTRLMYGDISCRITFWVVFFLCSFLSFFFSFIFSFLNFLFFFFLSVSGAPFSSEAPGHCPPMPSARYATALDEVSWLWWFTSSYIGLLHLNSTHPLWKG